MSVPDYQTFMLPVLRLLADGEQHRSDALSVAAADAMAVPFEERKALLPSGKATILRSRVGWAVTYMRQAGLIDTVRRGVYRITDRGRKVLGSHPMRVDNELLRQFPEFRAFLERSRTEGEVEALPVTLTEPSSRASPEEALEAAYRTLRAELITQVLDATRRVSPARFEAIVIDVLQAMGYGGGREGAARAVGRAGDGGIDGVIEEDRLGLDTVYVQAKRWEGNVGGPAVQAFAGALQGQRAHKGVMITTSDFSSDARAYAAGISTRIVLIDGQRLAEMMIDHDVGVSAEATYTIKRVDSDYFGDE